MRSFAELLREFGSAFIVHVSKDDFGAFLDVTPSNGSAKTTGSASYDCNFVC
jgi:hypothetical protein